VRSYREDHCHGLAIVFRSGYIDERGGRGVWFICLSSIFFLFHQLTIRPVADHNCDVHMGILRMGAILKSKPPARCYSLNVSDEGKNKGNKK